MKGLVVKFVVAIILTVAGSFIPASGQTDRQSRVNVPFDFYLNEHKFVAGTYVIQRADPHSDRPLIIIRPEAGGWSKFFLLTPATVDLSSRAETPRLSFNRYGDTYFLSEFIDGPANFGVRARTSKVERKYALAREIPVRETVSVVSK